MDPIASWLIISVAVERLIEVIVRAIPYIDTINIKNLNIKLIMAFGFGLVFSYGAQLDFFKMFGITFIFPYVGEAVTALFIMGGSNYVAEIVSFVRKSRENITEEEFNEIKDELNSLRNEIIK